MTEAEQFTSSDAFSWLFAPHHRKSADHVQPDLPYGTNDLDPNLVVVRDSPKRVRCFVRGCDEVVTVPRRGAAGDVCPVHEIRCHHSPNGGTYAYEDVRRNVIASPETFVRRVVGNPFKYESHRLGLERSEDALTWNVFRSLQEAGELAEFARTITGDRTQMEPFLYLWGICLTDDEFDPWNLLLAARRKFEAQLPVERPLTEPDIALHLPGRYLILIEAKFTSRNTYYVEGPRRNASSLTLDELRGIYEEPSLNILNRRAARLAIRIPQQLWRNTVFAEWMAREDHPQTRAYHVNLVRHGQDEESAGEFTNLIQSQFADRFRQITWESIHRQFATTMRLNRMCSYLATKTAGLRPAFRLRASAIQA